MRRCPQLLQRYSQPSAKCMIVMAVEWHRSQPEADERPSNDWVLAWQSGHMEASPPATSLRCRWRSQSRIGFSPSVRTKRLSNSVRSTVEVASGEREFDEKQ